MLRWFLHRVRKQSGQIAIVYAAAMVALIGAVGLGADTARMYYNRLSMQKAVDAAAFAAANHLPDDSSLARSDAISSGEASGLAASEIARPVIAPDLTFVKISAARHVRYFFARPFGLKERLIQVSAVASASGSIACRQCPVNTELTLGNPPLRRSAFVPRVSTLKRSVSPTTLQIGLLAITVME